MLARHRSGTSAVFAVGFFLISLLLAPACGSLEQVEEQDELELGVDDGEPIEGKSDALGRRYRYRTPAGAMIEASPGCLKHVTRARSVVKGLALEPRFKNMMPRITILISPQGKGIGVLPGYEGIGDDIEGSAAWPDSQGRMTVAITADSILRWELGLTHEIIHCYYAVGLSQEEKDALSRVHDSICKNPDPYANSNELLAYMGQWYLAGMGEVIAYELPALYPLLKQYLGAARVSRAPLTDQECFEYLYNMIFFFTVAP